MSESNGRPRTFTDTTGRIWSLSITVAEIKRVRKATGIDLYKLVDDQFKPLESLLSDPVKITEVLFVLCDGQHDATAEEFERAFSGEVVEAAANVFIDALMDFFPPVDRERCRRIIRLGREIGRRTMEKSARLFEEFRDEDLIEKGVMKLLADAAARTSSESSGIAQG
jgi:hypothetical protein